MGSGKFGHSTRRLPAALLWGLALSCLASTGDAQARQLYHHYVSVYSGSGEEGTYESRDEVRRIPAKREIKVQLVKNSVYKTIQGPVTFKFCIYNNNSGTATRNIQSDSTWRPGEDYRLFVKGSIVNGQCRSGGEFGPDGFSANRIEIEVRRDAEHEPDETVNFTVELLNPEHAKTIQVYQGTYTIKNDDLRVAEHPEVTIDMTGDAVDEGQDALFQVRIANPPGTTSPRRRSCGASRLRRGRQTV